MNANWQALHRWLKDNPNCAVVIYFTDGVPQKLQCPTGLCGEAVVSITMDYVKKHYNIS